MNDIEQSWDSLNSIDDNRFVGVFLRLNEVGKARWFEGQKLIKVGFKEVEKQSLMGTKSASKPGAFARPARSKINCEISMV